MTETWWEAPMEGSVLSFLKAEWKVSDTGSAHWASSCLANFITKYRIYLQSARMNFTMNLEKKNEKFHILEFGPLFAHFPSFLYWLINNSYLTGGYCPLSSRFWLSYIWRSIGFLLTKTLKIYVYSIFWRRSSWWRLLMRKKGGYLM